jgi:hypothetical protein
MVLSPLSASVPSLYTPAYQPMRDCEIRPLWTLVPSNCRRWQKARIYVVQPRVEPSSRITDRREESGWILSATTKFFSR